MSKFQVYVDADQLERLLAFVQPPTTETDEVDLMTDLVEADPALQAAVEGLSDTLNEYAVSHPDFDDRDAVD